MSCGTLFDPEQIFIDEDTPTAIARRLFEKLSFGVFREVTGQMRDLFKRAAG
jgi:hypothetical protein